MDANPNEGTKPISCIGIFPLGQLVNGSPLADSRLPRHRQYRHDRTLDLRQRVRCGRDDVQRVPTRWSRHGHRRLAHFG